MVKLVYCITKKAGLTDEEFFSYWKNIHGPSAPAFLDSADSYKAAASQSPATNTTLTTTAWPNFGLTT